MEDKITNLETELKSKVTRAEVKDLVAELIQEKEENLCPPETKVKEVVSTMLGNQKTEQKEREARKLNVIIYHVQENQGAKAESEETKLKDSEYMAELTSELGVPDVGVAKVIRLGKVPADKATDKPRPMKVAFDTEQSKKSFMSKLGGLAKASEKFKRISIAHDMTKDEREENRRLVEEAKAKNLANKDAAGKWTFKVRGLPGERKIVRVEKSQ